MLALFAFRLLPTNLIRVFPHLGNKPASPAEIPAPITVWPRATCPNWLADGSCVRSPGTDRHQQGRLGKVLIWGAVRAMAEGSPGLAVCPLQLFFMCVRITQCGDITSACTLPFDMTNTVAAQILVKPCILGRKAHLRGRRIDLQSSLTHGLLFLLAIK